MTHPVRIVLLVALVLVLAAGGYWVWRSPQSSRSLWADLFGPPAHPGLILVSGNIEAHESVLSFTQVQSPITDLPIDEGAHVARGTVLARVDDRLYRQQVEIDRANQQVAAAQVAVAQRNLQAASATVDSDRSDLAEKQLDLVRAEELARTQAGTVQSRDLARTATLQSAAGLARDQAMIDVATANVALAQANATAVAAKLGLDELTVGYATLAAPFDGVISVREAEPGQLAGPGVAIATLADLDHVWLRAYVNEPDLGRIRLGQDASVTTDTYPGKTYRGRIAYISPQAEFTPKTVETHAERITLVYRIRIDLDNPTHELLPGMPADASIAALPSGP
jgi:HlyD family secretion protein